MKSPYNRLSKDKLTLSFAGLLWQAKTAGHKDSGNGWFLVQPVENEIDPFQVLA